MGVRQMIAGIEPKEERTMGIKVELIPDEMAERGAHILGEQSAMALALKEVRARRAKGEDDLVLVSTGISILIVPKSDLVSANVA